MSKNFTKMQSIQAACMKTIFICLKALLRRRLIMGKGSGRRPTDDKKFSDNYDRIFGKKDADKSKHTDKKKTD